MWRISVVPPISLSVGHQWQLENPLELQTRYPSHYHFFIFLPLQHVFKPATVVQTVQSTNFPRITSLIGGVLPTTGHTYLKSRQRNKFQLIDSTDFNWVVWFQTCCFLKFVGLKIAHYLCFGERLVVMKSAPQAWWLGDLSPGYTFPMPLSQADSEVVKAIDLLRGCRCHRLIPFLPFGPCCWPSMSPS